METPKPPIQHEAEWGVTWGWVGGDETLRAGSRAHTVSAPQLVCAAPRLGGSLGDTQAGRCPCCFAACGDLKAARPPTEARPTPWCGGFTWSCLPSARPAVLWWQSDDLLLPMSLASSIATVLCARVHCRFGAAAVAKGQHVSFFEVDLPAASQ
jgi:hypothetical protein